MGSWGIFDLAAKEQRLAQLDTEMAQPSFWEDNRRAQDVIRERTELSRLVTRMKELAGKAEDLTVMLELAEEATDDGSLDTEIADSMAGLRKDLDEFELKIMLSGLTTTRRRSYRSIPEPAAPSRRTGRRCSCACTCAGVSASA